MAGLRISGIKVKDAMTQDFGIVDQSATLARVLGLFNENGWEEILIRDRKGCLVGIVTKKRLERQLSNCSSKQKNLPVGAFFSCNLITTTCEEDLIRARDLMRFHRVGRLPVLSAAGEVLGILTARDVCNGFSDKLAQLSEHMFAVLDNISEAIQVVDCEGVVRFWNRNAEILYGITAGEIVGKDLKDFFPGDLIYNVIETLRPSHNLLCEIQPGLYVLRNASPIVLRGFENDGSGGRTLGVVCTNQDVSHIRYLMDQLNDAKKRVMKLESMMVREEDPFNKLFYTEDIKTKKILAKAERVAKTNASVLIQGESGTGKELLAKLVFQNSNRSQKPFIEVNCCAIPESLFESEMFGYVPGSFTGACRTGKKGKFELAHQGTLFLDEIGELSLDMQVKLLRVLQEKRFYRVGGNDPVDVDVRIIAATNRNISKLVQLNRFREDLFYRLNVVTLEVPPLRERVDDIPGLTYGFLKKFGLMYNRPISGIAQKVMDLLIGYAWPGNVRQLQNMLESVIILMEGNFITEKSLIEAGVMEILTASGIGPEPLPLSKSESMPDERSLGNCLGKIERELITHALEECGHNKAKAAKLLGIPRSTLYYKIKSLEI